MTNHELLLLLKDKKILDSYQFLSSSRFKLISATKSFEALEYITKEQFNKLEEERQELFKSVLETGSASMYASSDEIDYFGTKVGRSFIIDKLVIEIFSTLHSFFDTYAQWINSALYANNALKIKRVTFSNIITKLNDFPEYSGEFISKLKAVNNSYEYKFISDINNIIKHRYQIYTKSKFSFFDGNSSLMIPKFHKDNNTYSEKEVLVIIKECIDFCEELFKDFLCFIETYFSNNDNNYTFNRLYNPKTYMMFENRDDFKKFANIKNSIHFIELDENNLYSEYGILLYNNDENNKELSMYNSIYNIIAIRDINSKEYVGILKPIDSEIYSKEDGKVVCYRKYNCITSEYLVEISKEMVNQEFTYFPYLSDLEAVILNNMQ